MKIYLSNLLLACAVTLLLACATASERPPLSQPPPSPAVLNAMGYDEVVQVGGAWVAANTPGAFNPRIAEATQLYPNYWRLRFEIGHEGKLVDVYFDGARREVVKSEEVDGVSAKMLPVK